MHILWVEKVEIELKVENVNKFSLFHLFIMFRFHLKASLSRHTGLMTGQDRLGSKCQVVREKWQITWLRLFILDVCINIILSLIIIVITVIISFSLDLQRTNTHFYASAIIFNGMVYMWTWRQFRQQRNIKCFKVSSLLYWTDGRFRACNPSTLVPSHFVVCCPCPRPWSPHFVYKCVCRSKDKRHGTIKFLNSRLRQLVTNFTTCYTKSQWMAVFMVEYVPSARKCMYTYSCNISLKSSCTRLYNLLCQVFFCWRHFPYISKSSSKKHVNKGERKTKL